MLGLDVQKRLAVRACSIADNFRRAKAGGEIRRRDTVGGVAELFLVRLAQ